MDVRLPLALAAVAAALLLLLCRGGGGGAEARVLLTLDDFGAVGDGIANDTQALLDAWTAACTSREEAVLAVPVGKAYWIWLVQLSGPCKKKLKLLLRRVPCPVLSIDPGVGLRPGPRRWERRRKKDCVGTASPRVASSA
ncbi:probable polygalacturonase At1g80170 [Miscanthus floridulus]|uniref:probable polygalacturonase At1g80170 n=1 Tax=Miscanthus floridulus TaxID=154761 RepID=UPI0034592D45